MERLCKLWEFHLSHNGSFVLCDSTKDGLPIVYASCGFSELTGYSAEECNGQKCGDLIGEMRPDRDRSEPQNLLACKRRHAAVENEVSVAANGLRKQTYGFAIAINSKKDGTLFVCQMLLFRPLVIPGRVVGLQWDVTDEVTVEQFRRISDDAEDLPRFFNTRAKAFFSRLPALRIGSSDLLIFLKEHQSSNVIFDDPFQDTQTLSVVLDLELFRSGSWFLCDSEASCHRILYASPGCRKVTGCDAREGSGELWDDIFRMDFFQTNFFRKFLFCKSSCYEVVSKHLQTEVASAAASQRLAHGIVLTAHKDRSFHVCQFLYFHKWHPLARKGHRNRMVGMIWDITEHVSVVDFLQATRDHSAYAELLGSQLERLRKDIIERFTSVLVDEETAKMLGEPNNVIKEPRSKELDEIDMASTSCGCTSRGPLSDSSQCESA